MAPKENEARRTLLDGLLALISAVPVLLIDGAFRELSRHVIIDGMLVTLIKV